MTPKYIIDTEGMQISERVFLAMTIGGYVMDFNEGVKHWPAIMLGQYDNIIPYGAFYAAHKRMPNEGEDPCADPECIKVLEKMKDLLRHRTQCIIDGISNDASTRINSFLEGRETEKRQARESKASAAKVAAAFKSQHKPAPEGTVKELATRYGKSLGEIRRLKAAGELHTLTEAV